MERQALHTPSPASSGFVSNDRGYFGGRGIARLSSSSQPQGGLQRRIRVLRRIGTVTFLLTVTKSSSEEETGPPPHISGLYLGGGTGPPPHNVGELTDDAEYHFVSRRWLKHVSRRLKHVPASDQCNFQTSIAFGSARRCAVRHSEAKKVAGTGATEKVRHVVTENISRDQCTITWTVNLHTFQAVRQVCVVRKN